MDAMMVMLSNVKITGKLRDTETVMRSLGGGSWKSANPGNSLAAYPTVSPVRGGADRKVPILVTRWSPTLHGSLHQTR